jgi:hypothetical protein
VDRGKNFARTGAFGPWMVTADEIPPNTKMTLSCRLNGERMQHATTEQMIFQDPEDHRVRLDLDHAASRRRARHRHAWRRRSPPYAADLDEAQATRSRSRSTRSASWRTASLTASRFIEGVNGLTVHVLEAGTPGRPCVLLLHGFPSSPTAGAG